GRTSGTVYGITAAGEARLRARLAEPYASAPARNGMLLRLFFGSHLPPGGSETLLLQAQDAAGSALAAYAAAREGLDDDASREQALRTITLSFGEHLARAQLAWAQESLAALAALDSDGAPRARG
ncbi:MAG TPA: hypothetical protein VLQ78_13765, partial [Ornithinibacter sp.]|nr:hypothetical protein [Ornithinibacter sp.]